MAFHEAAHNEGFWEHLEHFIIKYWFLILVVIFCIYLWNKGLFYPFIQKGVLPLIGTIILGRLAWKLWVHYIQQDFISGIDFVLLEIVPPRDVLRSPRAMELFITNALYHWSMKGGKEEYWQGAVWFWFSLEIASIEGQVHFYIRTPTRVRSLIETQMYAQYPQAQIKEVEDYTLAVDKISKDSAWNGWGCEFGLRKHQAFPVSTYVDFGLDDDPKEEYKVDPISPVIELFGSMQKGEQMWLQIVITPSKKEYHTHGTWFGTHDWIIESQNVIKEMMRPYTRRQKGVEEGEYALEIRVPDFYKNTVKFMSAKTSKLGFETGIRVMYVAKKEKFNANKRRDLRLIFRQYAKADSNEFWRINSAQPDFYSGIFTASPKTVMLLANRMLREYRERQFFHEPLHQKIFSQAYWRWPIPEVFTIDNIIKAYAHPHTFVLNTEELATIWHFPGQILKVPTLERIESKEAAPPTNLPI